MKSYSKKKRSKREWNGVKRIKEKEINKIEIEMKSKENKNLKFEEEEILVDEGPREWKWQTRQKTGLSWVLSETGLDCISRGW